MKKIKNVSVQRAEVAKVIAAAVATDAALASAEASLSSLDSTLASYKG